MSDLVAPPVLGLHVDRFESNIRIHRESAPVRLPPYVPLDVRVPPRRGRCESDAVLKVMVDGGSPRFSRSGYLTGIGETRLSLVGTFFCSPNYLMENHP